MRSNLNQQVALVTGGSSGIGFASAKTLADQGAEVIIAARNLDKCQTAVESIQSQGGKAHAMSLDVGSTEEIDAIFF